MDRAAYRVGLALLFVALLPKLAGVLAHRGEAMRDGGVGEPTTIPAAVVVVLSIGAFLFTIGLLVRLSHWVGGGDPRRRAQRDAEELRNRRAPRVPDVDAPLFEPPRGPPPDPDPAVELEQWR